jgi:predicted O-methyltransferase YrrM
MTNLIKTQFLENKAGWKKSFMEGIAQDENGNNLPWMTYGAIEFLQKTINKNMRVFEFGCGSSTLFFAKIAKEVIALETNKFWQNLINEKLKNLNLKAEIHLMSDGIDNENYQIFPQNFSEKFDLIVIDSIKRFACAQNAINFLNEGGIIILDDSQRPNYQKIFRFFAEKNFKATIFTGIEPGKLKLKETTIFKKN